MFYMRTLLIQISNSSPKRKALEEAIIKESNHTSPGFKRHRAADMFVVWVVEGSIIKYIHRLQTAEINLHLNEASAKQPLYT